MPGIGIGIGISVSNIGWREEFVPTDIDGCVLWLRADLGFSAGSWQDQSGAGNHATQATGSMQGTRTENWHNGRPAITFDGGDVYNIASGMIAGTPGTQEVVPWSLFVVHQFTNVAAFRGSVNIGASASGFAMTVNAGGGAKRNLHIAGVVQEDDGDDTTNPEAWLATNADVGAGAMLQALFVNGVAQSLSSSNANPIIPGEAHVGARTSAAGNPLIGHVAEVALFTRALNASERADLFSYSFMRYGL